MQYVSMNHAYLISDHFTKDWKAMLDRIDQLENEVRRIEPLERQVRDLQAEVALARPPPAVNPSVQGGLTSDHDWSNPPHDWNNLPHDWNNFPPDWSNLPHDWNNPPSGEYNPGGEYNPASEYNPPTEYNPAGGSSWTGAGDDPMSHGGMPWTHYPSEPSGTTFLPETQFINTIMTTDGRTLTTNTHTAGAATPNINFKPNAYAPTSAAMPTHTNDTMFQDHTMPTGTVHRSSALPTTVAMPTNAIIPHTGADYVNVAVPLSDPIATSTETAYAGAANVENSQDYNTRSERPLDVSR